MVEEVRTVVVEGVLVVCDVEVVVEEVEISGGGAPISEAQVQYISLKVDRVDSSHSQTVLRPPAAVDIVGEIAVEQRGAKECSTRAVHLVGEPIGAHDEPGAVAGVRGDPVGQAFVVGRGGGGNSR